VAATGLVACAVGLAAGACGAPPAPSGENTTSSEPTGIVTSGEATTSSGSGGHDGSSGIDASSATGDPTTEEEETGAVTTTGPLGVDGEFCSDFEIEFLARTPTVFVLVDQSSSMFDVINSGGGTTNLWDPMKAGVLAVVEQLQADVRFGFATYTGTQSMCTGIQTSTPIAENNFEAIKTSYDALKDVKVGNDTSTKGETPTPAAVHAVTDLLLADPSPGDRYIMLVSDGEPDFCDDNLGKCAADATIAALQYAHSKGIKSFVFGIENANIDDPLLFDFFAQGGAGESPDWEVGLDVTAYSSVLESECADRPVAAKWAELQGLLGNAPPADACGTNQAPEGNVECYQPAANYDALGGTATAFMDADPEALAEQIFTQVEALKSCVIEVNFAVNAGSESLGEIYVGDLTTPIPAADWRMNTPSQVELLGASCDLWLLEETKDFFAGFPCEVIVEQPIDVILR
jgi:hypothetical protein